MNATTKTPAKTVSTSKTFATFKSEEIKAFGQIVNKFNFDKIVEMLLNDGCKGNFKLFEDQLSKQKRYAFLCFALPHLVYRTNTFNKDQMSELRLANAIECLFNLPEKDFEAKVRTGYNKEAKKPIYDKKTVIGLTNLLKLWTKASAKKATSKDIVATV